MLPFKADVLASHVAHGVLLFSYMVSRALFNQTAGRSTRRLANLSMHRDFILRESGLRGAARFSLNGFVDVQ
jgi:hypothetical protein